MESTAYFCFNKASNKNIDLVLLTFRDAFGGRKARKKKRKVRKISCTHIEGFDLASIGFSVPSDLDSRRVDYFLQLARENEPIHSQVTTNAYFDQRFMAKLALGLSHVLFDRDVKGSKYSQELRKGLWYGPDKQVPKIRGISTFSESNSYFKQHLGVDYGVTISVVCVNDKVGIVLNVGRTIAFAVMCAELTELSAAHIAQIGEGFSLVLIDPLQRSVMLTVPELIAHNSRTVIHPELSHIEKIVHRRMAYFQNL